MEHKSWLWKKKSTEKTMIAADKVNRGSEDELLLADKAELERNLNISNERLSAALAEINSKDDIATKQTNIAREAIQGWEKAEAEVLALKQELEKATQQREASEERLYGVDGALKECMQQLRFVREEQEKRIHDAVTKTSREYEKTRVVLEEKLGESNRRLSKLSSENTQLNKTLLSKEHVIEELRSITAQVDLDLSDVMSKLELTQRENASLIYEVRMLEKELEIRSEERDFNRKTAEVAHKQHLESVKKIAKLDTETQRLRMLVRKRLPGPAALAKMKNEVELLGRDTGQFTRRKSNPFPIASRDLSFDNTSDKKITFLTEQLCAMEEENRLLKEFLNQKTIELSKSQTATGLARNLIRSHEFSMAASSSDMGSDEKVSLAESWAPSCRTIGASDIGLMDDFVEMEKLAIVSVEKPSVNSNLVSENHSIWLDNILKMILEHARITQKSTNDVLEDIKFSLPGKNNHNLCKSTDKDDVNCYISEESKTPEKSLEKGLSDEQVHSDINESIQRLIELIEGIRFSEKDTPTGYTVRIFQWKTSELRSVLDTFLQSCTMLLNGKAHVDFVKELTSALEWVMNHCFSLQDVSSMRDEIKKHFDWDETRSEIEVEGGVISHLSEVEKLPNLPTDSCWNVRNNFLHLEELRSNSSEERKLKDDIANIKFANKDLEPSSIQLQESEKTVGSLPMEAGALVEQDGKIEDQVEAGIMAKEDLDKQLIEASDKCNEAHEESTSVEEQKNQTNSNEELEAMDLDDHLLSESMTKKDTPNCDPDHDETTLHSEQEIAEASKKLAQCQETIINLEKQFKALASTKDSNKLISNPTYEITASPLRDKKDRISLLDKMLAEDASKTKEVKRTLTSPAILQGNSFLSVNGIKHQEEEEALVNFLSIVPSKKKSSGGVLKKLFWRRKKGNNK